MEKPTFTGTLNTVFTAHGREYLSRMPEDNFYTGNPTLAAMRRRSRKKRGGRYIIEPILEGGEPIGGSYQRTESLPTTPTDPVTEATYEWTFYAEPVTIFYQDEFHAGGAGALFDYLEVRINDARLKLERKLSKHLWQATPGTGDLNSIPHVISTTTTLGQLAPGTYDWWKAKNSDTFTFSSDGPDEMRSMANDVSAGGLKSYDWLVGSQDVWEAYVDLAENKHDITTGASAGGSRIADLGFPTAKYQGRDFFWDIELTNDEIYYVNNDAMYMVESDGGPFSLTEFQSMTVNGQQGRIAYLRWNGQVVARNRRCLGSLTTITV